MPRPLRALFIAMFAALLLAACAQEPTVQTGADAEVLFDRLHRVDNSRAALAFVDPEVDFSRFNEFMIDPLDVDNIEIIQPNSSVSRAGRSTFELTDAEKVDLQTMFREAMVGELQNNGYKVVDQPGDNVLRMAVALTHVAPTAPRDDSQGRSAGRHRIITQGGGSLAISVILADADNGEVLAVMRDSRSASNNTWGLNNRVSNRADIRRIFGSWARQFRARLDIIHG